MVKVRDGLLFVIADDYRLFNWRVGDQIRLRLGGDIPPIAGLVLAPLQLYRGTQSS